MIIFMYKKDSQNLNPALTNHDQEIAVISVCIVKTTDTVNYHRNSVKRPCEKPPLFFFPLFALQKSL